MVEVAVDPTSMAQAGAQPLVSMRGIEKRYGGRAVLADISLDIAAGEVHALVGENGAGKSTLGKILAGVVTPSRGVMEIDGHAVDLHSPRDALRHGVTAISQELSLVPDLRVLDNVFLGLERARAGVRLDGRLRRRYAEITDLAGFTIDPRAVVRTLPLAEQQRVEILRALARDARLIVFDEPTTVLDAEQTEQLHALIGRLRAAGKTIIYVSHYLEEVLGVSDRVTVLRDGRQIQTTRAADETPRSLITAMLGRELGEQFPAKVPVGAAGTPVLEARSVSGRCGVDDVSFTVARGEILAIAGLVGSGRTEVLRLLFGLERLDSGEVLIDGQPADLQSPPRAIAAGLALLPEDRRDQGLMIGRSIRENVTLATLDDVCRFGLIQQRRERKVVTTVYEQMDVRGAGLEAPVGSLSGGNQQKVLFARWLLTKPRVLLADEPTRGVDVGAKRAIYELLAELAANGTAIILVSSEIEEVVGLANRVIVLRGGRCVAELAGDEVTESRITSAAFGDMEVAA